MEKWQIHQPFLKKSHLYQSPPKSWHMFYSRINYTFHKVHISFIFTTFATFWRLLKIFGCMGQKINRAGHDSRLILKACSSFRCHAKTHDTGKWWKAFVWNPFLCLLSTLKVSKSQKIFFLETPLPKKRTKYLTKICPMKLEQNFVKYFGWFFGQWSFKKKNLFRFNDLYSMLQKI